MISTKRLRLVPVIKMPSHIQQMVQWLNDPDVTRYSEQRHNKHTVETQLKYIVSIIYPSTLLTIIDNDEDNIIGSITAHVDENNSVANVGILIGEKSEWGKGYGTEAWIAFCDHLLNNGIRKVEAGTMSINLGMIHIFRKSGMFYEGRRHAHFLYGKETVDMVMWGKFA